MEIKGTAVIAIRDFIKNNYSDAFDNWLDTLPSESQQIYKQAIDASKWYPLEIAAVIPTRQIGKTFFKGNFTQAARQSGEYSAQKALTGIYKIFVKASNPSYIIDRASRIFATYYKPCEMSVLKNADKKVILKITDMPDCDVVIEYRIAGWINKALEISGAKNVKVDFPKAISRGNDETLLEIQWD